MRPGEEPESGYAWTAAEQERRLPEDEYHLHVAILDRMEEEDLEEIDLGRANDYILWAAAQAFDEADRVEEAVALLRRIAASASPHPAIDYPAILLRLVDHLKDRGDYDEAIRIVDRVEHEDHGFADACGVRRAEILVLMGRRQEGVRLFETAVRRAPGDPWVPLQAAWALLQRGEYEEARDWLSRADQARRDVEEEEEAREVAVEVDRLRAEIEARSRRRDPAARPGGGRETAGSGAPPATAAIGSRLAEERDRVLAELDREEIRLVGAPPRGAPAIDAAVGRLAALHARASNGWDDAVEAQDEALIAAFDDLRWDIVGLAERFGVSIPGADGD